MTWTVHPAGAQRLIAAALILAVPAVIWAAYRDTWLSAVALVLLAASLRAFLLPTRYVLDENGVTLACFPVTTRRPWEAFEGFQLGGRSILLKGRRPVELKMDDERVRVVDFVRQHVQG